MESLQDGAACLNAAFAASCRPLVCLLNDKCMLSSSILRLVCKDAQRAADAERKRLEVCLSAELVNEELQPEHLQSLLGRLPSLTHAAISQEPEATLPPRRSAPSPSAPEPPRAFADAERAPPRAPRFWRSALSSLRPQHLRSLELEGLVLEQPPFCCGATSYTAATGTAKLAPSRGSELGAAEGAASGVKRSSAAAGPGNCTGELLAALLRAAPVLHELSLLRVEARAGAPLAALGGRVALPPAAEEPHGTGAPAAVTACCSTAWCGILCALPPSLTSLRLSLDKPVGCGGVRKETHGSASGRLQRAVEPCPVCLGAALRRLMHLAHLELSGLSAAGAVRALRGAMALSAAPAGDKQQESPEAAADTRQQRDQGDRVRRQVQQLQQQEGQEAQQQQGQLEQQQGQEQEQAQAQLEHLLLDVEGHLDLGAVRAVAEGLPRLRSLVLLEQAAAGACEAPSRNVMQRAASTGRDGGCNGSGGASSHSVAGGSPEPGSEPDSVSLRFQPLDSALWLLSRPALRRVSLSSDRVFTTLQPPTPLARLTPPGAATAAAGELAPQSAERSHANLSYHENVSTGGAGGARAGVIGTDGASASGGPCCCLTSLHLSLDLSAEALEPLVSRLPPSLESLSMHVGAFHRPSDVLAAYAAAADVPSPPTAAAAVAAAPPPSMDVGAAAASATAAPPHPQQQPLQPPAAPRSAGPLPSAPDSPFWLSVPLHSFLGSVRFLWPALTALPRVAPQLQELRLGGGAAAACGDHVLRCWAGASGSSDSLATPMVTDPVFNAMMRLMHAAPPQPLLLGQRQEGQQQGQPGDGQAAAGGWEVGPGGGAAAASMGRAPAGAGLQGAVHAAGGCGDAPTARGSEWSRSLQRVCLTAPGPTVAGALHLRRFMPGLQRLQVVVGGRLTDVALAGGAGGAGGGGGGGGGRAGRAG